MKVKREFFERDTLKVAKELLGKVLVRRDRGREIRGRILETEAYRGEDDRACHARFGKTARNAPMYGQAGHTYIYLCYGIHELLNLVTEENGFPAAALIRKIEPLSDHKPHYKSYGPGNLTKFLRIDRRLNGEDLVKSDRLWVEDDGFRPKKSQIKKAPRIGVAYAGEHAKREWRYYMGNF